MIQKKRERIKWNGEHRFLWMIETFKEMEPRRNEKKQKKGGKRNKKKEEQKGKKIRTFAILFFFDRFFSEGRLTLLSSKLLKK